MYTNVCMYVCMFVCVCKHVCTYLQLRYRCAYVSVLIFSMVVLFNALSSELSRYLIVGISLTNFNLTFIM